ncbi:methylene-fatty-acyl-phospholipid synthase [Globomyces pollinis-pini]|nr:methylene-fatty-acyl-phospholipid synthase [Globomyces pollinis-pini]
MVNETVNVLVKDSVVAFDAIDWSKPSLWISAFTILLSPLFWNVIARNEYRNKTLTKLFGSKELACSFFSAAVFFLGLNRDYQYSLAILDQPHGPEAFPLMAEPAVIAFGYIISTIGSMFVLFSMHSLGIHGTYLGDYFGILKTERVTGFPFNVVEHPMYYGSTMCFLGGAIWHCSPTGVLLSAWVLFTYLVGALGFEESFTNQIYSNAAKKSL